MSTSQNNNSNNNSNNFSELSIKLSKEISKNLKQQEGIYFTPKSIINTFMEHHISDYINKTIKKNKTINILEPSCGSCEFIDYILSLYKEKPVHITVTGVEYNKQIYDEISKKYENKEKGKHIKIHNIDYVKYQTEKKFDLIIGNPPYFVCKKDVVPDKFKKYIVGRPNIFGIFILKALEELADNGILAFIVPKSFLNASYYSKIRNLIKETCNIVDLIDFEDNNDFIDTSQSTFGLIIQKKCTDIDVYECEYSLKIGENYVFTPDAKKLKTYFEGATTLEKLNFEVKTGPIVWNENKELMTDDKTKTVLLYNTNITKTNEIKLTEFKNAEKSQYINIMTNSVLFDYPTIIVNRGNGNSKYQFKYALVENDKIGKYTVENHLNVVSPKQIMFSEETKKTLEKIIKSFEDERTKQFINLYFGNGGLSKTELETVLPIYL